MPRRTPKPAPLPPGRAEVPVCPSAVAARVSLAERMNRLADELRARNLHSAVLLAQQAACGHGPLVDHFCELGRVWGHLLDAPAKPPRARLRVIKGGAS